MNNVESISQAPEVPSIPPLLIKPVTRDEMPTVAGLVRSSAQWYRPILDEKDMAEHDVDERWEEVNFRRRTFFLGYVGDKAIGTISIQYFGKIAYLGYIYLDVNYVGRRYGQTLMKHAHRKAIEDGAEALTLIAHPEATWARKAYLRYGFEIIARNKGEVLAWNDGCLQPYYEEGFELYRLDLTNAAQEAV